MTLSRSFIDVRYILPWYRMTVLWWLSDPISYLFVCIILALFVLVKSVISWHFSWDTNYFITYESTGSYSIYSYNWVTLPCFLANGQPACVHFGRFGAWCFTWKITAGRGGVWWPSATGTGVELAFFSKLARPVGLKAIYYICTYTDKYIFMCGLRSGDGRISTIGGDRAILAKIVAWGWLFWLRRKTKHWPNRQIYIVGSGDRRLFDFYYRG